MFDKGLIATLCKEPKTQQLKKKQFYLRISKIIKKDVLLKKDMAVK